MGKIYQDIMVSYQTTAENSLTTFPRPVTALFHHNRIFFTRRSIKTVLPNVTLIDRSREKGVLKIPSVLAEGNNN